MNTQLTLLPTIPHIIIPTLAMPTNSPTPTLIHLYIPPGLFTTLGTSSPTTTSTPTPTVTPTLTPTATVTVTLTPTQYIKISSTPAESEKISESTESSTATTTGTLSPTPTMAPSNQSGVNSQQIMIGVIVVLFGVVLLQQWPKIKAWLHNKTE